MNKKWLFALGFLVASMGGTAMAQDEPTLSCWVKPVGNVAEIFAKCKAGDVLVLWDFPNAIAPVVCDLSKQVVLVGGRLAWCVYIGYVRKER